MPIVLRASAAAAVTTTGDWTDTPTHGSLWIGSHLLDTATITPAVETPENGDTLRIVAQGAPFTLTVTGAGEPAIEAILSAGLDEITATVRLHTADPGTNGTANEIAAANNPGYAAITLPLESAVV